MRSVSLDRPPDRYHSGTRDNLGGNQRIHRDRNGALHDMAIGREALNQAMLRHEAEMRARKSY